MDLAESAAAAKPPPDPLLAPLLAPASELPGVGPGLWRLLRRLLGSERPSVLDLVSLLPSGALRGPPLVELVPELEGSQATLACLIGEHRAARRRGLPYRIAGMVGGTPLDLVFFNARGDWLARRYPPGLAMRLHGRLTRYDGRWQMAHPEPLPEQDGGVALYPLTEGLTQGRLRQVTAAALERLPELPEWLDEPLRRRQGWPSWCQALLALHRPGEDAAADPAARQRLAYDELLATQLGLQLLRQSRERQGGRSIGAAGDLRARLLATLPFAPTAGQAQALREVLADMASPSPMLRLLMGDVGSGKTLVALLAMLEAVEAGGQAVLMVPTEVLARQHAATLGRLLAPLGLEAGVLAGREAGQAATRRRLAEGGLRIVVGTHALFQDGVDLPDLALAVVDEQHRFGVHQRLGLRAKGRAVDMLLLSATPIPRTLLLSAYGDVATSRITEKPPGRQPVGTAALPATRVAEVVEALERALAAGERAFWICPSIEESEATGAAAAESRAAALRARFGERVGLVHGRMSTGEKAATMAAFTEGRTGILVATTVVEVGVDVPEATVIVIEAAERFGLAQLHQLRGRVGRGARPSHCLLVYTPPLTGSARARLAVLRDTDDGFRIAEEDLRLRGPGEVLGVRQSGLPAFRFADLAEHRDLLAMAQDDARLALGRDPALEGERGRALRLLLGLFERETAMALLAAG
ncbi:MAG TPA: ATP-dependent DNA helicase RecG [Geminicoccaceae bacterium]|nr:ATP-dependent DNA helicase RecG [Geminicoccus sp.]HMU52798.1 ATP-dependent DNA helicase RecG [Geminicoccaceae bacterium]